jgi:hypothetical protein
VLFHRTGFQRSSVAMVNSLFLLALELHAYETPLSPASVHEAWVLGQRNDQATADFLTPYLQQVAEKAAGGPHLVDIEVLTPFAEVVDESRKKLNGYTEQQALQEYHQRGDRVTVRILLMLPAAYPKQEQSPGAANSQKQDTALRPENFWQNFRFNMKQRGKIIATRSIHDKPIYSAPTKDVPAVLDGASVWLEYDARDVASEPATVVVVTPEAKTIEATFDLKKLR